MKRLFLLLTIFTLLFAALHAEVKYSKRYNKVTKSWNSYPEVTIHSIQFNQLDSLKLADTLQTVNQASHWTLQVADRVESATKSDDTVTVTALCVIPPKMIAYTGNGFTMVLYDTGVGNAPWSGIIVRCNAPTDTLQNISDGFLTIERGDIIKITGVLSEFSTGVMNSLTQFQPIPGITIDILNPLEKAPVPPPVMLGDSASIFYKGAYVSTGPYHVQYSTGEQYEGMYVEFRHLTTGNYYNANGRSLFEMTDGFGNTIGDHDASRWFTINGAWRDTACTFTNPPNFSVIDTIRGVVLQVSGGAQTHGYLIAPMYQVNPVTGNSDVQFGVAKPTVFNHKRIPSLVHAEETFEIRAQVFQTAGGWPTDSVFCFLSTNNGPFQKYWMDIVDTSFTYGVTFDASSFGFAGGTLVKYFIQAFDTGGQSSKLAYQKTATETGTDTSVAFFNFTVLNLGTDPTIRDIQYTPYPGVGVSSYVGATVTLRGIVTVDSSDMVLTSHNNYNPKAYFIQSGNQPWSGIWIGAGTGDTSLAKVRRGDSISVTAPVSEFNTVTELFPVLNTATVLTTGNQVPAPVDLPTSALTSGSVIAEQYEGMLVRFFNTHVAELTPYFSDPKLYSINDGTGDVFVGSYDGRNTFTNAGGDSTLGRTSILYLNTPIDTITGIVHYNASAFRWAVCPRQDNDFTAGYHITFDAGWNLISIGREQTPAATGYAVAKLFPGASSLPFKFAGSYVSDTAIWPGVGYWLKVGAGKYFRQLGAPIAAKESILVSSGWNLVGMIGDSIPAASVVGNSPTMTLGTFFGYKGGYVQTTELQPSKGYWVKTNEAGSIGMSSTAFAKSDRGFADLNTYNSLTIENKSGYSQTLYFGSDADGKVNLSAYEMPPFTPTSSMDVRFASGRILETYPTDVTTGKHFGITVRNSDDVATIKWNIQSGETKGFTLTDGKGNPIVAMNGTGTYQMNKVPSMLGIAVVNGADKPKEFALSQNFPNPFNPTTQFTVSLPQTAHLEVGVYNVLGQKVATLANDMREAGTYSITWNSNSDAGMTASSGVYFLKMTAGNFTSVRKIMLMK